MRKPLDKDRVLAVIEALGQASRGRGDVFLTGGACAVLLGWRSSTVDIDLRFDPEPAGIFAAIPRLKDDLGVNIELASPQDFIPVVPGWRDRSDTIDRIGGVTFHHYDFISQALAKLERGHTKDLADVRQMVAGELVQADELLTRFDQIRDLLIRYPALDADRFEEKIRVFVETQTGEVQ